MLGQNIEKKIQANISPIGAKRRAWRGVLAAAAAFLMCVAGAAADLRAQSTLEQTPSNSWVVLRVRNLQDASQKLSALAQQIGVATMQPELADPLGALLKMARINAGLNKNADFEVAIVGVSDYGITDPEMVRDEVLPLVLAPVSDYQAFLGNFRNVQTEAGVSTFNLPKNGPKVYCVQWGSYAAISPAKDVVTKKPDGLKVSGVCGKEFDTKDLTVYANIGALSPKAKAALRDLRKNVNQVFGKATTSPADLPPGITAGQMGLVKVAIDRCFAGVDRLLDDAQAATFSINIEKDGIGTSLVYEFKAGSYMADVAHGIKSSEQPHLVGLPDKPYIVYGASRTNSAELNKLIDDIMTPTIPELQKAGFDTRQLQDCVADIKAMEAATETEVFGVMQPSGAFGKSSLLQTVMIGAGDARTAEKAELKMVDDEQDLMKLLNQGQLQMTPNAKTIEDVQLDAWTITPPNANNPQAKQMAMMLAMMYGPGGLTTDSGVVDDKRFIAVQGLDDKTIAEVISAVKNNSDTLEATEGFKLVSKHLPANSASVFYLDFGNLLTAVNEYARQFGVPLGLQVQANLPPIGVAVAGEGDAVRIDSFTPADLIQNMVTTAMMMIMRMNQGGAPGGPGGL